MREGTVLWRPSEAAVERANLTRYQRGLGTDFDSYADLWKWSVTDLDRFWSSMWDFFDVPGHRPPGPALADDAAMPGASWFPGTELNYVEQALRWDDDRPAVVYRSEGGLDGTITHRELRQRVAGVAQGLRELGVGRGDRVAAYAPNIPETLIAFLATASLGAVWSSCSPDFGVKAVLDRFRQIEPKVLVAVDGYRYRGTVHDRSDGGGGDRGQPARAVGCRDHRRPRRRDDLRRPDGSGRLRSRWSGCRSTTRCGSSTRRERRACPRPSSTATAGSCSSTSRPSPSTTTSAATTASSGSARRAG